MKRYFFLVIALISLNVNLYSQSQFSLYQLNAQLPQANMVNAGIFPDYKVTVGIPTLSSIYISGDMGELSFNRIFTRTADSLYFDPQQLETYLDTKNHIAIDGAEQLIYLGLRLKKNFFSISLNERVEGGISYPKSLVRLIYSGSGINIGEVFAFDELAIRGQVFHELAFGYGREINEKLSIGIKAKFLSGIASIDADKIGGALVIGTDSLYLYSPAFNINTAGLELFNETGNIFDAATAFNNKGFAIDLGAHYWLTDKLNLSVSLNDLGSINWENDTRQLQFPEVRYAYSGMDLVSAINNNEQDALFKLETDSLINLYEPDTVDGIGYVSSLSPKFYAGATYHVGKLHTFGAMLYGDVFKGNFKPAFGLSYNLELGNIWTIGVNASYRNQSFKNFGMGTVLTLGAFQIYAVTENIVAFAYPADARFVDLRVGINLVFGKLNKQQKKVKDNASATADIYPEEAISASVLSEPVIMATVGTSTDELTPGYYTVIASFNSKDDVEEYSKQLQYEGYAAHYGYQSELGQYYSYLMYSPDNGNRAIELKNTLIESFSPGLETPWVLWVKEQP